MALWDLPLAELERYAPAARLYPLGHGPGYTRLALSNASLRMAEVSWNDALVVDMTVSSAGERAGEPPPTVLDGRVTVE